jgi:hypothetical protein
MSEIREFKVEFVHWDEIPNPYPEEGPVMCDFCEKEPAEWWCEFLVTGYCKKCMEEQIQNYKDHERRQDE